MQQTPQNVRPHYRSAFGAAFLSLVFPGLGHLYAGATNRAIGFAAAPILATALLAGVTLSSGLTDLAGTIVAYLPLVLILNVVALVYRVAAAIDAYRVAAWLNAAQTGGGGRLGPPRIQLEPISVAGLLAVCLVIAGGHGVIAYYGVQAQDTLACIFDPSGTADAAACGGTGDQGTPAPGSTAGPAGSSQPSAAPTDAVPSAPLGSPVPNQTMPTWNGTDRLNILLIGADQRPNEGTFNTDTMIVVSVDPKTKQVAMFSLPRDTTNVPIPAGPARSVFGSVFSGKINGLWTAARNRSDAFPGNAQTRGYNALKSVLGGLYGLNIQYYVSVNFTGFKSIVDTIGGVDINVQNPVMDDRYPGDNGTIRVYIPTGMQPMTGSEALIYARSRHGSNDFDRAQRQQRVILSIRQQMNPATVLANLTQLMGDLKSSFKTDIPQDKIRDLIGLSSGVDTSQMRSFVFSPPQYATEVYIPGVSDSIYPNTSKIRQAVATAFKVDAKTQAQLDAIAAENAVVWVVNGSGQTGQASDIASYLENLGITASAPNQRPGQTFTTTRIQVFNGRESALPTTIALLQRVFGVTVTLVTDPSVQPDIIITTGTRTPDLTPPPAP